MPPSGRGWATFVSSPTQIFPVKGALLCYYVRMSNTTHISIRIDSDVLKAVGAEAKRRKWSRNATIQHLVEYGLPDSESEPIRTVSAKVGDGVLPVGCNGESMNTKTKHPKRNI